MSRHSIPVGATTSPVLPGILRNPGPAVTPQATPDRWYAVVVGRDPRDTGVYKDYANVDPLVNGVSGAQFQGGFKTKVEAESYLTSVVSLPVGATPT
jgi:hypothetical protein